MAATKQFAAMKIAPVRRLYRRIRDEFENSFENDRFSGRIRNNGGARDCPLNGWRILLIKGNKADIVNDFTSLGYEKGFLIPAYTRVIRFAIIALSEKKKRFAQEPPKVS